MIKKTWEKQVNFKINKKFNIKQAKKKWNIVSN